MYKFLVQMIVPLFILTGCANADENGNKADEASLLGHKIVQKLLDNPDLNSYFHVDVLPQRKPLVIVSNGLFRSDSNLTKFGHPVIILDDKASLGPDKPYLEIMSLTIEDKLAEVRFSYPVEGIVGTLIFQITGKKLNLIEQNIVER